VLTAAEKVVPPEFVMVMVFGVTDPPTIPETEIVPTVPELIVNDSVLVVVPLTVLLKEMLLPVEADPVDAAVMEAPNVTAPV
jgi:hypothetical protein